MLARLLSRCRVFELANQQELASCCPAPLQQLKLAVKSKESAAKLAADTKRWRRRRRCNEIVIDLSVAFSYLTKLSLFSYAILDWTGLSCRTEQRIVQLAAAPFGQPASNPQIAANPIHRLAASPGRPVDLCAKLAAAVHLAFSSCEIVCSASLVGDCPAHLACHALQLCTLNARRSSSTQLN